MVGGIVHFGRRGLKPMHTSIFWSMFSPGVSRDGSTTYISAISVLAVPQSPL